MNRIRQQLLSGWHLMRIMRLVFGLLFIVQAIMMKDALVGLMAAFFLYQAVTNTGCCGESCAPMYDNNHKKSGITDITFEEVK